MCIRDSDTHDDEWIALEKVSGGEEVWIIRAIYEAFASVRTKNTGQRSLTAFRDEADGALQPEAKEAYFRLFEATHEASGRTHTIVITHSRDIQGLIGQHIVMSELEEPAKQEAVA